MSDYGLQLTVLVLVLLYISTPKVNTRDTPKFPQGTVASTRECLKMAPGVPLIPSYKNYWL